MGTWSLRVLDSVYEKTLRLFKTSESGAGFSIVVSQIEFWEEYLMNF